MSTFSITQTPLDGVAMVERVRREDQRGFFSRLFCAGELRSAGFDAPIAQINHTLTVRRGTVRGLHFQHPPHAEIKFVSVLDVALDVRKNSPTFLRWHAEILSAENRRSLLIPHGFAHGFQALADHCELIYLHSCAYAPQAEAGIQPTDPTLGIQWPLAIADLSPRDASHPLLSPGFIGVEL
jgi:dTDP-4-dehydrorhamnose 3,5-epimerase